MGGGGGGAPALYIFCCCFEVTPLSYHYMLYATNSYTSRFIIPYRLQQGWGAGRNRVFLAEPEPLEKKQGAGVGVGAAWKKSQEPEPEKISWLLSPARR